MRLVPTPPVEAEACRREFRLMDRRLWLLWWEEVSLKMTARRMGLIRLVKKEGFAAFL